MCGELATCEPSYFLTMRHSIVSKDGNRKRRRKMGEILRKSRLKNRDVEEENKKIGRSESKKKILLPENGYTIKVFSKKLIFKKSVKNNEIPIRSFV